ncbi:hypothetical protein PI124_g13095 [Phytophthora idaei]|nr:hypothetical protein PI124_g13095 [Phytophthora idaei]
MQNFSRDVAVPEAQAPFSVDDITAALSSLQTYCTTFMATEVGDLVRSLHAFAQQEIPQIWPVKDLQHFVFWIDGVLEAFREATVHDLHGGYGPAFDATSTPGSSPPRSATVAASSGFTHSRGGGSGDWAPSPGPVSLSTG